MQPTKAQVVLFRRDPSDGEPRILLMEKSANGASSWHLITGFIEAGETPEQAASRETLEESGLYKLSTPIDLKNEVTFVSRFTDKPECERAFAIESLDLTEKVDISNNPDSEHVGFRWAEPDEAYALLQWESFKESVRCLQQHLQS